MSTFTDGQLFAKLKSVFGYSTFRPLQREIIQALLRREDVLVLMPTGAGKSLCFQLPALLAEGTAVVISPLIALMKDQVDRLQAMGVAATYINSMLTGPEIARRTSDVARGKFKLVYLAPERLMMPGFLDFLAHTQVSLFAIDEAHCISEWGHDFRPEYRQLAALRKRFPVTPIAAFTATATARVQEDIVTQLGLRAARHFEASFNRPNLRYQVQPKERGYEQLLAYVRQHPKGAGIVYCLSRKGTEEVAGKLQHDGVSAVAYHAGLEAGERQQRQEAFVKDDVRVMVATIAFGMGIDKPDIRFVVHYDLPKSLEGYYQESGRAGRDGEASDCLLLFGRGDVSRLRYFIDQKEGAERQNAERQLEQMVAWADSESCRRAGLLAYFGEKLAAPQESCCDVCSRAGQVEDYTERAQMLLSCAKRTGESFGLGHLVHVVSGSKRERVLKLGHDKLPIFGVGKQYLRTGWGVFADKLVKHGYLMLDGDYRVAKLTTKGLDVLLAKQKVLLPPIDLPATERSVAVEQAPSPSHEELFTRLRALRKEIAEQRGIAPFVVFHDSTLRLMAAVLPQSLPALGAIQGVGERKLTDYGRPFLEAIRVYVQQMGAKALKSAPAPRRVEAPRASTADSVRMFKDGAGIEQIAMRRGFATSTIVNHLATAMEAGESLDLGRLVSPAKRRMVEAVLREVGGEGLKPVLERLGAGFSYDEIRIVRAALRLSSAPVGAST